MSHERHRCFADMVWDPGIDPVRHDIIKAACFYMLMSLQNIESLKLDIRKACSGYDRAATFNCRIGQIKTEKIGIWISRRQCDLVHAVPAAYLQYPCRIDGRRSQSM